MTAWQRFVGRALLLPDKPIYWVAQSPSTKATAIKPALVQQRRGGQKSLARHSRLLRLKSLYHLQIIMQGFEQLV
jgi:hypothetical protein